MNLSRISSRIGLAVLDVALLLSLLQIPVLWLIGSFPIDWLGFSLPITWGPRPLILALILAVVRGVAGFLLAKYTKGARSFWRLRFVQRLLLFVFSLFFCLAGIEFILQLKGFDASTPPMIIKGSVDVVTNRYGFVKDMEMMWKFSPGGTFKGWTINSMGFREREIDPVKRPGMKRVICLGDSCTADGGPPYAGCLHQLLTNAPPTSNTWEAFNMAVYGYSSVQGLRVFLNQARALKPDVVTLYFGWNDHWLCGYRPDSHRMAVVLSPGHALLYEMLCHKRFGQRLLQLLTPGRSIVIPRKDGEVPIAVEDMLRVPQEEYRQIMTRFVAEIRAAGAIPVIITAPCRVLPTEVLVSNKQAHSRDDLNRLHDEYVQITREVAAATGAPLLDLRRILGDDSPEPLFFRDGMHLTQQGLWRIGEELYKTISVQLSSNAPSECTPVGTWRGWAGNDTNMYDVVVRVDSLSSTGSVCGSFSNITLGCSGTYRWINLLDGTYFMQVEDREGACVEDHTDDYLRCLPDGTLLYTSHGSYTETLGTLNRIK